MLLLNSEPASSANRVKEKVAVPLGHIGTEMTELFGRLHLDAIHVEYAVGHDDRAGFTVAVDDGRCRCTWCGTDPLYVNYHDTEWGVPEWDSRALFEKLILDGFQAGLSWITILRKRDNFRKAFDGFVPEKIVRYTPKKLDALMLDEGIIRKRVVLLERRHVGLPIMVFASIKLAAHGERALPDFDEAVRRFPEVIECYTLMGGTDYLLKIVVPDVEAYERFLRDKLYQLPAVRETNSAIALSEIKNTTALPV